MQQGCPLLSFAAKASQQSVESRAVRLYEQGTSRCMRVFRAALHDANAAGTQLKGEDEAMLLFTAVVVTAMLSRAVGGTDWIKTLQTVVLEALPA